MVVRAKSAVRAVVDAMLMRESITTVAETSPIARKGT